MTPQRIGVVGLGLIGGSLACRLRGAGCEVLAWNHTTRPYAGAEARGIRCLPTIEALAAAQPDLLVLCNPLKRPGRGRRSGGAVYRGASDGRQRAFRLVGRGPGTV